MKKFSIIGFYMLIMFLVLSTNQSKWFGSKSEDFETSKPLINEVSAALAPTWISPRRVDPNMTKNWALKDNGALAMKKAWQLGSCNKDVVIAIIDTGVDYNHPDLKANLWKNPKEIPNNQKDDDMNGFIDDEMGWDFVSNDHLPYDHHGHGTHIAGIIGAVGGNGIGTTGVCGHVSLMILKYYDANASGKENLRNSIDAFEYAVNNGAHIINYSGGGAEFSKLELEVIRSAREKGILVVAAAGNESQNADKHGYYPASYDLDNIVSVASMTQDKNLVKSSNFGIRKIDIAAPGKQIYSTLPKGKYGYMTGTSQATAFVTGIAALALSQNSELSFKQLKQILVESVDPIQSLTGKIKTGGMINAHTVLKRIF